MYRIVLALLLALGIWSAKTTLDRRAREQAEAEARARAELDVADRVAAQAGAQDLETTPAGEADATEEEAPPEEDTDHVVHCVMDGGGTFVRESECLAGGGRVDEPDWARLD